MNDEIKLKVPLAAFKHVLRYIYTGSVSLQQMNYEIIFDLLSLAHEYKIEELVSTIPTYLMKNLTVENCCAAFDAACLYDLTSLKKVSLHFIDQNSSQVISTDEFRNLRQSSLCTLLERDSFYASEVDIFRAMLDWLKCNQNVDYESIQVLSSIYFEEPQDKSLCLFQEIICHIRFNLMDFDDLFSVVRESSILDDRQLLDVIQVKTATTIFNYRWILSKFFGSKLN